MGPPGGGTFPWLNCDISNGFIYKKHCVSGIPVRSGTGLNRQGSVRRFTRLFVALLVIPHCALAAGYSLQSESFRFGDTSEFWKNFVTRRLRGTDSAVDDCLWDLASIGDRSLTET